MTEQNIPTVVAPLRNVALLGGLVERVVKRAPGLPGMAAFYGPSGYGKTFAAIHAANKGRAYHVQVDVTWTRKHLALSILKDMGIRPAGTIPELVEQIGQELALSGRPLLIDEADILVKNGMIEVVRAIYERSQGAIILIGEEELPRKLLPFERVHNRMLDWAAAEPVDLRDAKVLAGRYCPDLAVADDLLAEALSESAACTRRLCVNLNKVAETAAAADLSAIDLAAWRKLGGQFFTGRPPARRF
ncbi:putative phage DNA transposition protein [Magnetospirillum sp. XM-1]|uniref:AAA family ATPase n=1 Tax=Magnetospirillum sp. XM-1 TaxID=1663591 RepID=UPI00073DDBB3|nr:ATP-binding protein [Magnetospirillum sp. XM-1]CUW41102.1 putative phage DNA transposition protein [Magnetospirillum sp. XM-1]